MKRYPHFFLLISCSFFLKAGIGQKLIVIDSSLSIQGKRYTAKQQKSKPRKFFEYEHFRIVRTERLRDTNQVKEKSHFKLFRPLLGQIQTTMGHTYYRMAAHCGPDTVTIDITLLKRKTRDIPGFFSKRDESTKTEVDSIFANIQIGKDSIAWLLTAGRFWINYPIRGTLTHADSSYQIESINDYQGKHPVIPTGPLPKGIGIRDSNNRQIAASQFRHHYYLWFSQELPGELVCALGSAFSMILGLLPNEFEIE